MYGSARAIVLGASALAAQVVVGGGLPMAHTSENNMSKVIGCEALLGNFTVQTVILKLYP
jgi:hypothetical protein